MDSSDGNSGSEGSSSNGNQQSQKKGQLAPQVVLAVEGEDEDEQEPPQFLSLLTKQTVGAMQEKAEKAPQKASQTIQKKLLGRVKLLRQ